MTLEDIEEKKIKGRTRYQLTAQGGKALQSLGVDSFPKKGSKRMYAYGCVDWTERGYHLGGGLAAEMRFWSQSWRFTNCDGPKFESNHCLDRRMLGSSELPSTDNPSAEDS